MPDTPAQAKAKDNARKKAKYARSKNFRDKVAATGKKCRAAKRGEYNAKSRSRAAFWQQRRNFFLRGLRASNAALLLQRSQFETHIVNEHELRSPTFIFELRGVRTVERWPKKEKENATHTNQTRQ